MSDEEDVKKDDGGDEGGGWIVTFADLMSLLLTFFVLLLSFSEMNVKKFKKTVGEIKKAFGVQTEALYENTMTSNNPFKDALNSGSKEIFDWSFSQPRLAFDDKDFCNLYQRQRIAAQRDLKALKDRIEKTNPDLSIDLKEDHLVFRLYQGDYFQSSSSKMEKTSLVELINLYKSLDRHGADLRIRLTNYSPEDLKGQGLKDWSLSNQRTLAMAVIAQRLAAPHIKDVKVVSQPNVDRNLASVIDLKVAIDPGL